MSPATHSQYRQAFITGLRNLADYLDQHPAVPVPAYGTEILLSADSTDNGGCAQVDHFARQLGITVEDDLADSGHYRAVRSFGPVGYRMAAISDHAMARHHAESSYTGCVTPDTWT
jgi:hypothetical protein